MKRKILVVLAALMAAVFTVNCGGGGGGGTDPGDTTPPSTPQNFTATVVSSSRIDLAWSASSDDSGVAGYKVYRNGTYLDTTSSTSYPATGLTASTYYCFSVLAYDAAGNESGMSSQACRTTSATSGDTQAPTVPTNLTATAASSSQINLSWTASTDNVGVTGYKIYRGATFLKTVTTGTSTTDAGLSPSTNYCYQVAAIDAAGNESGKSSQACATTSSSGDTQAPTVPTGLSATAATSSQINLSWNASTDNVGVTGYKLYRGTSFIKTVTTGTSTTDTGLSPSTNYCYQVSAIDAAGNESGKSSHACATTQAAADTQAPTVPTNLSATAVSSNQINLSWTASTDNVGIAGYKVYSSAGSYLKSVTVTSTSMTGLNASTQYCYRVSAYDAAGNESGQSSQACATTAASMQTVTLYAQSSNCGIFNSLDNSVANTVYQNCYPTVGINSFWSAWGYSDILAFAGLVKFNVSTLAGKTIDSAILRLEVSSPGVGYYPKNFKIGAVATSWNSTTVTWNIMSPFQYYTASWLTYSYPTYSGQVYNINLKATVQNWANGTYANNGLGFLSADYSNPGNVTSFDAYDFYVPTLTVTYY